MHDVLHWLPISQRIQYHITTLVSCCVLRCAHSYLCDLCWPVSVMAARWVLCSAARGELLVLWAYLAIMKSVFNWGSISMEWSTPLTCIPCWWPTLPNFTSLWSLSTLVVTGLGAPLSSSLLKRLYISLQNEWMNEWMNEWTITTAKIITGIRKYPLKWIRPDIWNRASWNAHNILYP